MTTSFRKVALVTGSARRIGKEIALALAAEGWDIVVHYGLSAADAADTVAAIEALGQRAWSIQCDLADETAVRALLPGAVALCGAGSRISCLVNNAALFDYDGAADFSVAKLDRHMHTNLAAPILLTQALHAATAEGMQAVSINLLDQKLFNLNPDFLSYTLSKSALRDAIPMLAMALAPKVRVVGIAPGLTLISHLQSIEEFDAAHTLSPLGQSSQPGEVAAAVVFAASNRAFNGATMLIDAGQHLLPLSRDFSFIKRSE